VDTPPLSNAGLAENADELIQLQWDNFANFDAKDELESNQSPLTLTAQHDERETRDERVQETRDGSQLDGNIAKAESTDLEGDAIK
jgi:hypothetical protein